MTTYKRRVRIYCDPKEPIGQRTHVLDLETGQDIKHIKSINIKLDVEELNQAHLTYYKVDDVDQFVIKDGEPVMSMEVIDDPAIDITALETLSRSDIEALLIDALFEEAVHHKQWYLWQIARTLGLHLNFDEDRDLPEEGIAP